MSSFRASATISFTTTSSQPPQTPMLSIGSSTDTQVVLIGTGFIDFDPGSSHAASDWLVDEGGGNWSTPVRATGVAPVELVVDRADLPATVRRAVTDLLGQVEGTVGVITPLSLRDAAAEWVPADDRVQLVNSLEAKGMEYDGVVVVEPGSIRAESGPRTLYVTLSRATQRLTTVATGLWRE